MLCRFLLEHTDYKILLSVPTTQLVEQMVSDFADYEQPSDPFKVSEQCHKVYNGIDPKTDKRIVVSTWQSMYKQSADYLRQFECYICDEAHKADGKSISGMIAKMAQTNILRFGLTGTLNGTKCHEMQLRALFGNIIKTRSTRQLMKDGNLASHTRALENEEYIAVEKTFIGRKTNTRYRATAKGRQAFQEHLEALEKMCQLSTSPQEN